MKIDWCCDGAQAESLADFFLANVDTAYISHGELQTGRADDFDHWSPRARQVLNDELSRFLRTPLDAPAGGRVVVATMADTVVGLLLLELHLSALQPYAILHDLVVARSVRGQGVGTAILAWIENELKARGILRLFLESGIHNERAHEFFRRAGFATCSIVMSKKLSR